MSWSRQVDNVSSFDDNCGTKELLDLRLWSTGGHRKSRTYRMISNISGRAFSRSFILSFMAATMALALSSAPCLLLFSAAPRRQNKYFLIVQACHKLATRRVRSTFWSHCPLSSYQHHWLNSPTLECWESNLGQLGLEASLLTIVVCRPPMLQQFEVGRHNSGKVRIFFLVW